MIGTSDRNRSERQGGRREANLKEACSKDTTVGTRTDYEASVRRMSVLGNAKSHRLRKAHIVESGGTGRKFMHLTRGDLPCFRTWEKSAEAVVVKMSLETWMERRAEESATHHRQPIRSGGHVGRRNSSGPAISAGSAGGVRCARGWIPEARKEHVCQVHHKRDPEPSDDER